MVVFLDSPATTSATTYSIDIKVSANTVYVNRTNVQNTPVSSITAIEVAA